MIMKNVQSKSGSVAVMALLIMATGFLAIGGLKYADDTSHRFEVLCHTPGEVSADCIREFPAVPVCVEEDCSDRWPNAGYRFDDSTGRWFYQVPDTPLIIMDQS